MIAMALEWITRWKNVGEGFVARSEWMRVLAIGEITEILKSIRMLVKLNFNINSELSF